MQNKKVKARVLKGYLLLDDVNEVIAISTIASIENVPAPDAPIGSRSNDKTDITQINFKGGLKQPIRTRCLFVDVKRVLFS